MYDKIIENMSYRILFDFDGLDNIFWNSTSILTSAFLVYWGIKLGVWFIKDAIK